MNNPMRLVKMVRKWQKLASMGRRRIMLPHTDSATVLCVSSKSKPNKGHFVVYSADGMRFVVPLAYLSTSIFLRLFEMSEEEFGLPGNRPITLPCNAMFMDYIVSVIGRCECKDVEKALLGSIATSRRSTPSLFYRTYRNRQILLHGF